MKFKNWLHLLEASMHPEIKQDAIDYIKKAVVNYFSGGGEKLPFIPRKNVIEEFTLSVKDNENKIKETNVELIIQLTDVFDNEEDSDLAYIQDEEKKEKFPHHENPSESHHFYHIDSYSEEETTYEKEFEKYKKSNPLLKPALAKHLNNFESDDGNKKNAIIKVAVDMHPNATLKNVDQNKLTNDIMASIEKEIDEIIK